MRAIKVRLAVEAICPECSKYMRTDSVEKALYCTNHKCVLHNKRFEFPAVRIMPKWRWT